MIIDNPDYVFYRLEKGAGAATFVLNSENGLQKALQAASDILSAEYTIAYYPPPRSRKVRKIEAKVDRHDMRVRPGCGSFRVPMRAERAG
jgi:hypothetical protein